MYKGYLTYLYNGKKFQILPHALGGRRWKIAPMAQIFTRNELCKKYQRFRFCSLAPTTENTAFRAGNHLYTTKQHPLLGAVLWWAEVDSNHRSRRRQIYSLIHLAALESAHIFYFSCFALWSRWLDSNPQPADYKSAALPIELHRQVHHIGGALGRNWTTDRQIFSLLLYQLSYQGINGDPERARTVDLQRDRLAL